MTYLLQEFTQEMIYGCLMKKNEIKAFKLLAPKLMFYGQECWPKLSSHKLSYCCDKNLCNKPKFTESFKAICGERKAKNISLSGLNCKLACC